MNRALIDYNPETELPEVAAPGPGASVVSALSDVEQTELAADLLNVTNEAELDHFLGTLMQRTTQAVGRSVRLPVSRALKAIFQASVRQAMPQADRLAAPRTRNGERAAARAASFVTAAGRFFGLELEGLSPEDQELEIAKAFIRFAHEAVKCAAAAEPTGSSARAAARSAVMQAAQKLAPGLLPWLAAPEFKQSPHRRECAPLSVEETIMHDIDRTQMELDSEAQTFETEELENGEFEAEEFEYATESEEEYGESMLSEAEEFELAAELLSVGNEAELDQFLGNFIKSFAKKAGKVIRSPFGQAAGGILKGLAGKLVPIAGGALGGMVGGPIGAKIGSGLASAAGNALGLEAETLEREDFEFEGAKQFVRLAADTMQNVVAAPANADPKATAQAAVSSAVKKYAPGLMNGGQRSSKGAYAKRGRSGRWLRRGNHIVLLGV
jgi:hypothetical protein